MSLSLALTADLHWGHSRGMEANIQLIAALRAHPPDVLVLAGDIGSGEHFAGCLEQFAFFTGKKCLVPGNHDIWVPRETEENSWHRYHVELPAVSRRWGFHYLDEGPLLFPDEDLGLVGTINWYDYTWAIERIQQLAPGEEHRLISKRFTRGRHNDANFVRWAFDDPEFTSQVVGKFEQQLLAALDLVKNVVVIAHHPPLQELGFPRDESVEQLDVLLWDAFSGNQAMETILRAHADRISLVFCGHTHRARECQIGPMHGINIGGDYQFKRLITLDWPSGLRRVQEFF
jgi:3',5'-cyclic AMP phosphodiesterase CpdA